jgi:CheY-like chemotaxis protein
MARRIWAGQVHVRTDLGKFRQILLNLLSNAVKYTEHGEIALTVRLASQEGTYAKLVFEIRDTGVGITAQDQEKLFQPFYQTEYGIKLGEGTGLGLAICRQYTELLGGTISLESKVGQGSVFTVTLPVEVLPGMAPSSHATHVQHIAGESVFRILVAEDKPDNQRLISELLERVGFEVRIAQNGEQAVEMFQSWHPDFIWMDMRMPVMSGYEAAKTIRGLPGGQDIPIVALTASAFEEDRANILEAGCNDWLRKPVDADRIFEMMAQYLKLTYVYAKEVTESVKESGMENVIEGETLLSDLPDRIKDELRQAAMLLDAEAIRNIALQIAADHPAAADSLRNAAEQYNFEQLQQRLK